MTHHEFISLVNTAAILVNEKPTENDLANGWEMLKHEEYESKKEWIMKEVDKYNSNHQAYN